MGPLRTRGELRITNDTSVYADRDVTSAIVVIDDLNGPHARSEASIVHDRKYSCLTPVDKRLQCVGETTRDNDTGLRGAVTLC